MAPAVIGSISIARCSPARRVAADALPALLTPAAVPPPPVSVDGGDSDARPIASSSSSSRQRQTRLCPIRSIVEMLITGAQ